MNIPRQRFLIAFLPIVSLSVYLLAQGRNVSAQNGGGPLYSAHEKLVLTRNHETGAVTGTVEKGNIAVAYVNLWSRQTVERSNTLYTPVATVTDVQPVILFSHCDLPYKFSIQQGKLQVSGSCSNANWDEPPIEVIVLYSK